MSVKHFDIMKAEEIIERAATLASAVNCCTINNFKAVDDYYIRETFVDCWYDTHITYFDVHGNHASSIAAAILGEDNAARAGYYFKGVDDNE